MFYTNIHILYPHVHKGEAKLKSLTRKTFFEEKKLLAPGDIASGLVLTGGTSRLEGTETVACRILGLEARRSVGPRNVANELKIPEYSTVLGLLHYALTGQDTAAGKPKSGGLLRRISNLLSG